MAGAGRTRTRWKCSAGSGSCYSGRSCGEGLEWVRPQREGDRHLGTPKGVHVPVTVWDTRLEFPFVLVGLVCPGEPVVVEGMGSPEVETPGHSSIKL